ncbi:MAG: hypothetical protein HYZ27_10405 [Deltaproteobacteria bacterium]|nr:hypothetical protein [Deltaproteobacteria bacterium]
MRRPVALAVLFAVSCSDPTGCTGCGGPSVPYPDPAPPGGAVQPGVMRLHVTQHALDFLATHVSTLLADFMVVEGDRAVYYLDEAMFDPASSPIFVRDGCIGEPDSPCPARSSPEEEAGPTYVSELSFDLYELSSAVSLTWLDPDVSGDAGFRFAITDLSLAMDMVMVTNIEALGAAACHLSDPTGNGGVRIAELSFDLRLGLDTTSGAPVLTSRVENVLLDLPNDDSAVSLAVLPCDGSDPSCDDPRCHGAWGPYPATDCVEVCELFDLFAQLGGFFATLLEPALGELAPTLAAAVSDGLMGALGGMPLEIETELPLATLSGGLLPGAQPLYLKAGAGALDVTGIDKGRGLDIGVNAGSTTLAPAVCAQGAVAPDFSALLGPPPAATGFVEVFDSATSRFDPYHLSVSIAEAVLAQAMWSAFQSGAFCFSLDTYDVEALAGGAFSLTSDLLMSFDLRLAGLTHEGAPMKITLWATRPTAVRLGAGREVAPDVYDPLIEIIVDDLELSISMLFDDSMMRVSGVLADLVVQIGVERSAEGVLELVVNNLELANARQTYNEIAPAADISGLFALVIDLAVSQVVGDAWRFPIDISSVADLGLPLSVQLSALRRDVGPTGARYLGIYAGFCDDSEVQDPNNLRCYQPPAASPRSTALAVHLWDEASLYVPADPARFAPSRFMAAPSGRALLRVDAGPEREDAYVHQFRVDGGAWSTYRPAADGLIEVLSARLLRVGRHTVDVQSRLYGDPRTQSLPQSVSFWVDRERPQVTAWSDSDAVWVEVEELGSPEAVQLWARHNQAAWQPVMSPVGVQGLAGSLEILARDAAGNSSEIVRIDLTAPAAVLRPADSEPRAGCSSTPHSLLAALIAVFLLRRRRVARAQA